MPLKKFKFVDPEETIMVPGMSRQNKDTMTDEMVISLLKSNASWSKHFVPLSEKELEQAAKDEEKERKAAEKAAEKEGKKSGNKNNPLPGTTPSEEEPDVSAE